MMGETMDRSPGTRRPSRDYDATYRPSYSPRRRSKSISPRRGSRSRSRGRGRSRSRSRDRGTSRGRSRSRSRSRSRGSWKDVYSRKRSRSRSPRRASLSHHHGKYVESNYSYRPVARSRSRSRSRNRARSRSHSRGRSPLRSAIAPPRQPVKKDAEANSKAPPSSAVAVAPVKTPVVPKPAASNGATAAKPTTPVSQPPPLPKEPPPPPPPVEPPVAPPLPDGPPPLPPGSHSHHAHTHAHTHDQQHENGRPVHAHPPPPPPPHEHHHNQHNQHNPPPPRAAQHDDTRGGSASSLRPHTTGGHWGGGFPSLPPPRLPGGPFGAMPPPAMRGPPPPPTQQSSYGPPPVTHHGSHGSHSGPQPPSPLPPPGHRGNPPLSGRPPPPSHPIPQSAPPPLYHGGPSSDSHAAPGHAHGSGGGPPLPLPSPQAPRHQHAHPHPQNHHQSHHQNHLQQHHSNSAPLNGPPQQTPTGAPRVRGPPPPFAPSGGGIQRHPPPSLLSLSQGLPIHTPMRHGPPLTSPNPPPRAHGVALLPPPPSPGVHSAGMQQQQHAHFAAPTAAVPHPPVSPFPPAVSGQMSGQRASVTAERPSPRVRPEEQFGSRSVALFDIEKQIGEGTYGQVYKAHERATGDVVALKRIRMDSEKEGFPITAVREIKILSQLQHRHIVHLREIVTEQQSLVDFGGGKISIYMVFDYMEHDISGLFQEPETVNLSVQQVRSLTRQLLEGLAFCHDNRFMHRDIKGSNLLVNSAGHLQIADFGLARNCSDDERQYTNNVITLWYRPPELILGECTYGKSVDMWSVGCILAEFLAKRTVFRGNDEISQLDAIFKVCGSPTNQNWPEHDKLPNCRSMRMSRFYTRRLKDEFRLFPPDALDLVDKLLVLNPSERLDVHAALAHPFVQGVVRTEPLRLNADGHYHEFSAKKRKRARESESAANAPPPTAGPTFLA